MREGWDQFAHFISFKVGDGTRIEFWQDPWCGTQLLLERFPELYRIASDVEALVADCLILEGETLPLVIRLAHTVNDWELESVANFMDLIYLCDQS